MLLSFTLARFLSHGTTMYGHPLQFSRVLIARYWYCSASYIMALQCMVTLSVFQGDSFQHVNVTVTREEKEALG
eukprot:c20796_g1_i1 orf=28-249(-)